MLEAVERAERALDAQSAADCDGSRTQGKSRGMAP